MLGAQGLFVLHCCEKGSRFCRSHPKDRPIQSPLTTRKGMLRTCSNLGPNSVSYNMQEDAEDLFLCGCSQVLTLKKCFVYRGSRREKSSEAVASLPQWKLRHWMLIFITTINWVCLCIQRQHLYLPSPINTLRSRSKFRQNWGFTKIFVVLYICTL
jgi:hypothetical protein